MLNFEVSQLAVKYLGVPLISTKLSAVDCAALASKLEARIKSWANKHLSYVGQMVLDPIHFVFYAKLLVQYICVA